ncbi:hypothetical protein COCSADRAFT_184100 [Bipolaris sorokiniana ND90Pr]|uniref:Uncharacterized protein n=1 Tax=Cochliobolus sativus (strain ND90Pr / ATCC 201652) TaxID=665912 RepID=M2R1V7_COCSN|nr:uncharacterized protein COCSADRAFT_184100 [Bipolaris sorokiniana ND90Pr]EMD61239.1 hypothetical protein COCSADRAFT_184100 [Bipolaris sorokiniana ND90Pr]
MSHQCFAYVVLASLLSSQVLAAPTGRPSVVARYAAMCDDPAISWDEKKDVHCPICVMDSFPMELWDKYCGPTMAPSVTHQYAAGVWRRDDGSEGELASVVESVAGGPVGDSGDNDEDTKLHALPYLNHPKNLVPVLPDTGKHIRPFPIAMPVPIEPPQIINPRPISELNPGFPTDDEVYVTSKRRNVQSIEPVDKDFSEHLITSGLWAERHHKADGVYRREDALPNTEPAVSSLPVEAMTAEGDEDFLPKETVAVVSDQNPDVSEDQIAMSFDKIAHKPASIVWRREVPRPANNFRLGYPLHHGNGRAPLPLIKSVKSIGKEYQKREASPVPPPEFFEHGHSPSKPLPPLKPNQPISIPSDDWTTYEALPIVSPESSHIPARQSPGASEPGLGDDYAKYEKQRKKEEKRKAKEDKKKAKDEEVYSTKPPHVWFTPAITHMQVTNIHRRDDAEPQQTTDNLLLPLGKKPTWKYTLPWYTPAVTHPEANDIHRRAGTQQADLDFADGKRPVWTPALTHMKWPDIHRREERIIWTNQPPTASNPAKMHGKTWVV